MTERLLTTREVAAFPGMSPESVLLRYRGGELPGNRLSSNVLRFRESKLATWVLQGSGDAIRSKLDAYLEGLGQESPRKAGGFGCMNEKPRLSRAFERWAVLGWSEHVGIRLCAVRQGYERAP